MASDYDLIIVGAGVAGSATAIRAAQKGLTVMLLDRGEPIGSKNMSGGVLWGNDLAQILGEKWWEKAPVERYIVNKGIGILAPEDSMIINLHYPGWGVPPAYNGWSVLRSRFDPWLANQAKDAGADVYEGVNINELLIENGRVNGIIQEGNEFKSKTVVLAEGTNPRLAVKYIFRPELDPKIQPQKDYMLGIKEVIALPPEVIQERFNITGQEGTEYEMLVGSYKEKPYDRSSVGAFLYTNKETISLGVVIQLETVVYNETDEKGIHTYELWERFKQQPWIAKMIKGGKLVEYAAHLVPHGGYHMIPKLYGDGVLIVGDTAGFVLSNGQSINGMNFAIASGILAADTVVECKQKNDFSEKGLSLYKKKVEKSYIHKNLKKFRKVDKLLSNPRLFNRYAEVITGGLKDMLTEDERVKPKAITSFRKNLKKNKVNIIRAAFDALNARHI